VNDVGPVTNRPLSGSDLEDSYTDDGDRVSRYVRLDRLVTGRERRARLGDVDGTVQETDTGLFDTITSFETPPGRSGRQW
jgi:hypothetical protein